MNEMPTNENGCKGTGKLISGLNGWKVCVYA